MGKLTNWNLTSTALLTIDLQNDFIHPKGAYGRAGQTADSISALPARVAPLVKALRAKGGYYISAQFSLVPGPDGEPLIAPHLKELRPFLTVVDGLHPADFVIEKVAYSSFYQTRLEYIMRAMGIENLIVAGIVTNGGVASTLRDAHLRNIETLMLTDGCGAFRQEVHDATILSLGTVTQQMTCAEALGWLEDAT